MMNKTTTARLLGAALLVCAVQAQADITWTFNSPEGESTILGNTITKTSNTGGVQSTAKAWSNTNDGIVGSLGANGYKTNQSVNGTEVAAINNYKLETAYLNVYSGGLGVKNQDANYSTSSSANMYNSSGDWADGRSPEHSTDNDQRYDSVLFTFDSAVDLNTVSLGYWSNDSDISVLRFDNDDGAASTTNIAGKSYAELLTSGWNLVSQISTTVNTIPSKTAVTYLDGTTASSYWLIGAANPLLGTANTDGKDQVKILALAGEKYVPPCTPGTPGCGGSNTEVPEPGTLLLLGAGLVGMTRMTRRKAA